MTTDIRSVVLCGGSGTRLWPLSRQHFPKQFAKIVGERTLLDLTLARLSLIGTDITCLTNEDYRFLVMDHMAQLKLEGDLILEPSSRNTAPAMALAALTYDPNDLLLFCPSDHFIPDGEAFRNTILEGVDAALDNMIVTFGIRSTHASSAYGYIEEGDAIKNGVRRVRRFIEKPSAIDAEKLIKGGHVLWNGGIFLTSAGTLIDTLKLHAPDILSATTLAHTKSLKEVFRYRDHPFNLVRPDRQAFNEVRSESIDYAVLEKASNVAVVPFDGAWSDVGSWNAVADLMDEGDDGNRVSGRAHTFKSRDTFVLSQGRRVVTLGVSNLLIVDTPDAILVADRDHAEGVKDVVNHLKQENFNEADSHRKASRPWGSFDAIDEGDGFKVKRIVVSPQSSISLQRHQKRSEHWVVVEGLAEVTLNDKTYTLKPNESTYIPKGETHRLKNIGEGDLVIIEVQVGVYLGEDDIERFEDNYGRKDVE